MDRLISEFEVIRAIEKYVNNIFTKSMGDLVKAIKNIPSAEPKVVPIAEVKFDDDKLHEIVEEAVKNIEIEPKWIPVSERLPEFIFNNTVSEDVLVFDGVDIRVGEYRKGKYLNGAGYWRVYDYDLEEYVDVIAWMPLPSCYEPQERSDKECQK